VNIKTTHSPISSLNIFDLLGQDEVALSKAFAYVLAREKTAYFAFLRILGLRQHSSQSHYNCLDVTIEKRRSQGRTDIELRVPRSLHIIIECKIASGRITAQRRQYLSEFDSDASTRVMCYITQERGSHLEFDESIQFRHISWIDIVEMLNSPSFIRITLIKDFLSFAQRTYRIIHMREILVQDLGNVTEVKRFRQYNVYRRDESFITPLYFAPYFTRNNKAKEPEGITSLSKVLGVLTLNPTKVQNVESDLRAFTKTEQLIQTWRQGIRLGNEDDNLYTYFFLDNPVSFARPLMKSHRRESRNWIGSLIPKNRCVTFADFVQHIPELMGQK